MFASGVSDRCILFNKLNTQKPVNPKQESERVLSGELIQRFREIADQRIRRKKHRIKIFGIVTSRPILENSIELKPEPRLSAVSRIMTLLAAPTKLSPPARVLATASATHALTFVPVKPAACIA